MTAHGKHQEQNNSQPDVQLVYACLRVRRAAAPADTPHACQVLGSGCWSVIILCRRLIHTSLVHDIIWGYVSQERIPPAFLCLQEFGKTKLYIPKQDGLEVLSKEVRGSSKGISHVRGSLMQTDFVFLVAVAAPIGTAHSAAAGMGHKCTWQTQGRLQRQAKQGAASMQHAIAAKIWSFSGLGSMAASIIKRGCEAA